MSEEEVENQTEEVEEQDEKQGSDEREYTEIEQEALQQGWSPEGVEGKRALTAEEFLDRKPLYDDLRKRGKEIRDLRQEINDLRENDKKVAERMYQMALNDLKQQKKTALDEGDTDKVLEIDDNIRDLDKDRDSFNEKPQADSGAQEAFQDWVSKNPWYQNDPDLAAYADGVGPRVLQENPHLADKNGNVIEHEEFLSKVTERTKKAHPEKFKGGARRKSVEGDTGKSAGNTDKRKYSIRSLDEEERQIAKRVIEATGMKEEDYMKSYLGES